MNVTDSANFYVSRPADVSDMLLHRQVGGKCNTKIFCLGGKGNISIPNMSGDRRWIWKMCSIWCNKWRISFIIVKLEFIGCYPCLYIWDAILHALDWGIYLIRTARNVQLSVVCKRLVGDGVLSNECSKWFCIQDEPNGSKDRPLWDAKVEHRWLWKFIVNDYWVLFER